MAKWKVSFNFTDSRIVEAEDEQTAIENFLYGNKDKNIVAYEEELARNNELIMNRVIDSLTATQIKEGKENGN